MNIKGMFGSPKIVRKKKRLYVTEEIKKSLTKMIFLYSIVLIYVLSNYFIFILKNYNKLNKFKKVVYKNNLLTLNLFFIFFRSFFSRTFSHYFIFLIFFHKFFKNQT